MRVAAVHCNAASPQLAAIRIGSSRRKSSRLLKVASDFRRPFICFITSALSLSVLYRLTRLIRPGADGSFYVVCLKRMTYTINLQKGPLVRCKL